MKRRKKKLSESRRLGGLYSVKKNRHGDYDIINKDGTTVLTVGNKRLATSTAEFFATIDYYAAMPSTGNGSQEAA